LLNSIAIESKDGPTPAIGAQSASDLGADYLVCQGIEAGGDVQSSTALYELLPKVLERAQSTPVLAAGGIGHGRKIREALLAGASGAMLGTRFVATQENLAHPEYKSLLIKSTGSETTMSVCFQDGWPGATHRSLRNSTSRALGGGWFVRRLADGRAKVTWWPCARTEARFFVTMPSHP